MLKSRSSKPFFHEGRLTVLKLSQFKQITGAGDPVPCGLPTVGFKRFYEASRTEGLSADLVATVPWQAGSGIPASSLIELTRNDREGTMICKVIQVQERRDTLPPCYQLTLQREKVKYEDLR